MTAPTAILAPCKANSGLDYALSGELSIKTAASLWPKIRELAAPSCIDLSGIHLCDGCGAALLFDLHQRGHQLSGLAAQFQRLLDAFEPEKPLTTPALEQASSLVHRMGDMAYAWIVDFILQVTFVGAATMALLRVVRRPQDMRWRDFIHQCEQTGANALPIVALIAFLIGVILSFQSVIPLRQFGAELFVANLLGLSLTREMGPLIIALLLSGRTGAAFSAELGTMKVNEEVNALITFGFDPVRFLVLPRLLAGMVMAPLLTACAELIGLLAGALVLQGFNVPFSTFFHQIASSTDVNDFLGGMFKSAIFGLEIAAIGCLRGLSTGAGASAVGHSTTRAVVQTLVVLVVTDGIFAVIYYQLGI